jgi:hypothetical protein
VLFIGPFGSSETWEQMLLLETTLLADDTDAFRLSDDLTRSQVPLHEGAHFDMAGQ